MVMKILRLNLPNTQINGITTKFNMHFNTRYGLKVVASIMPGAKTPFWDNVYNKIHPIHVYLYAGTGLGLVFR